MKKTNNFPRICRVGTAHRTRQLQRLIAHWVSPMGEKQDNDSRRGNILQQGQLLIISSMLGMGVLYNTASLAGPLGEENNPQWLRPDDFAQVQALPPETFVSSPPQRNIEEFEAMLSRPQPGSTEPEVAKRQSAPQSFPSVGESREYSDSSIADREPAIAQVTPPEPPIPEPTAPDTPELEELQEQWLLPVPPVIENPIQVQRGRGVPSVAPGSSLLTPTAFGPRWGQAFVGAGFQERTRFTDSSDGAISVGFGVGDPRKTVGLQTSFTVLDLLDNRSGDDGFFNRGAISFKVSRVLPNDVAIAGGIENAIVWGFTDVGTSAYGVVTKVFRLQESTADPFSRLTLSLGVGNGRFRTEDDFNEDNNTVNVFGSVAVRVARPVSAIANWTGQDLSLGVSVVPFRNIPLVVTPSLDDITGNAGDGTRFRLSVGYSYFFPGL